MSRLLLLPLFLSILISTASARDLTPSVGVSYSHLNLSDKGSNSLNLYQSFRTDSVTFDLKWPICDQLDLNIGGGPSRLSLDINNQSIYARTVTTDGHGNLIGMFGDKGVSNLHQRLDGYNFNVSLRWYLK